MNQSQNRVEQEVKSKGKKDTALGETIKQQVKEGDRFIVIVRSSEEKGR